MSKYRNPNMPALKTAVEEMGGKVTGNRPSGKHFLVYVKTKNGNKLTVTLSKGPMREGHIAFWIKQRMRRADDVER